MLLIIAEPSEEYVKAWILALLLWASAVAAAHAQQAAPLVVGSVRDQAGDAVAGAMVSAVNASGSLLVVGRTAADGTFALSTADAANVHIECDFCLPLTLRVSSGEPLAAVVHRFTAVMRRGPSPADVAALPYARAESVLSLTPYVVLSDSQGIAPGPLVSDRGLSAAGGLVLDDGVPVYDVTANISPFASLPFRSAQSVAASDAAVAFRYGDRADAGTVNFETLSPSGPTLAVAGGDGILQTHVAAPVFMGGGYVSTNSGDGRGRVDADWHSVGSDGSFDATVLAERGSVAPDPSESLTSSFSAARLSFERTRAQRMYGQLIADRGNYGVTFSGNQTSAYWSDISMRAGVESISTTPVFVEAAFHRSNGEYAPVSPLPNIAASLSQAQVSAGISVHGAHSDLLAGISAFDIAFDGGPQQFAYGGITAGASTSLVTPSLDYRWRAGTHWSFDSLAASTFRLPTLLERYGAPPVADVVTFDRNALFQETIEYTDRQRARASLTSYRQQTHGLDNGVAAGVGAAFSWALSTHWSVRSWFLHETDTRVPPAPYLRLSPFAPAASVGSAWLTYENGDHLRGDAIFRRDLIGGIGFNHVDAALSFPAGNRAHLFVSTEVWKRTRFFDIGVRFDY